MTGDRESEGDGEPASEGLDPDAVVAPRNDAPAIESAADADAEGESDLDIPLPWNTVSDDGGSDSGESDSGETTAEERGDAGDGEVGAGDADDAGPAARPVPEEFEDLRFVGPKTGPILRESGVSIADVCEKRVSYRDLTDAGVNPGVAAKIRREHSLSWSLDGGGTDLDRRSSQIRGLDDDERAWIAESSEWSAGTDARGDADGRGTEPDDPAAGGAADAAAGEAAWRARTDADAAESDGDASAYPDGETAPADADAPATAGEAAWRAESVAEGSGNDGAADVDRESAWRQRSVPTPLTAVEGFDDEVVTTLRKAGIGSVRRLATADPDSVADALELGVERVRAWRDRAREHESSTER